jgi:hypothetical protein
VLDGLPDPPSYSAVRAMLRVLEEKGHLRHESQGPRYVYLPTVPREKARTSALKQLVQTFFDGSTVQAVAALLDLSASKLSGRGAGPALPADPAGEEGGALIMTGLVMPERLWWAALALEVAWEVGRGPGRGCADRPGAAAGGGGDAAPHLVRRTGRLAGDRAADDSAAPLAVAPPSVQDGGKVSGRHQHRPEQEGVAGYSRGAGPGAGSGDLPRPGRG